MFVAKYDVWITQVRHGKSPEILSFDGVKDMMAYYFAPELYGGKSRNGISEVWVKDYYSLKWLDGRQAFYVTGSDVHGPMGHELVPFSTRAAAGSFLKDHHGNRLLAFTEITSALVEEMRGGSRMMKMK